MSAVRILLVEDNPADARLVSRRLSNTEHVKVEVEHAEWMKSALTLARNKPFDLVLLDLSLPDSHGIDTVVAMRKELPNTPIIVLSAQEDLNVATRALEAGAENFIVKSPEMTTEELEREILYCLERWRRLLTSKTLMQRSMERLSYEPGERPSFAGLATEHANQMDEAVTGARAFLHRNNPALAEQVEQVLKARGYFTALQDLRSIMKMDEPRKKRKALSERAIEAIYSVAPDKVEDPESTLLDVLNKLDANE